MTLKTKFQIGQRVWLKNKTSFFTFSICKCCGHLNEKAKSEDFPCLTPEISTITVHLWKDKTVVLYHFQTFDKTWRTFNEEDCFKTKKLALKSQNLKTKNQGKKK